MIYRYNGHDFNVEIKKRRQNSLTIRIKTDGTISVNAPYFTTQKAVEKALVDARPFLDKYLSEYRSDLIHYMGKAYYLHKVVSTKNEVVILGDDFYIYHKEKTSPKKVVNEFYKNALKAYLDNHFLEACREFGIKDIPTIRIRDIKRAYGKYAKKDNVVTFAIMLAKYEERFIRLTMYHELTHYFCFDHSANFYALLEEHYPNSRKTQKEMNKIKYLESY